MSNTHQYNIKEYIIITITCSVLCEDNSITSGRLDKYVESIKIVDFKNSSENEFLQDLVQVVSSRNEKRVTELIDEKLKIYRSYPEITKTLSEIKKNYVYEEINTYDSRINNNNINSIVVEEDDFT